MQQPCLASISANISSGTLKRIVQGAKGRAEPDMQRYRAFFRPNRPNAAGRKLKSKASIVLVQLAGVGAILHLSGYTKKRDALALYVVPAEDVDERQKCDFVNAAALLDKLKECIATRGSSTNVWEAYLKLVNCKGFQHVMGRGNFLDVMAAIAGQDDSRAALRCACVILQMRKLKLMLTADDLNIVMANFPAKSKLDNMLVLLQYAENFGVDPNQKTFELIIRTSCHYFDERRALVYYNKMSSDGMIPSKRTLLTLIELLLSKRKANEALEVLAKSEEAGFVADETVYAALVCGFIRSREVSRASKHFKQAMELNPDARTISNILSGFVNAGRTIEAVTFLCIVFAAGYVIEAARVKEVFRFSFAKHERRNISRLIQQTNSRLGVANKSLSDLFDQLIRESSTPSKNMQVTLRFSKGVDELDVDDLIRNARVALKEIIDSGKLPSLKIVRGLAEVVARHGDRSALNDILKLRWSYTSVNYFNMLLTLFGQSQNYAALQAILLEMKRRNVKPDRVIFSTISWLLARSGAVCAVERVHDEIRRFFMRPRQRDWNALMYAYAVDGKPNAAMHVFSSLIDSGMKPDSYSYGHLVRAHLAVGDLAEALAAYLQMKSNEIRPHVSVALMLGDAFARNRNFRVVQSLCDETAPLTKDEEVAIGGLMATTYASMGYLSASVRMLDTHVQAGRTPSIRDLNHILLESRKYRDMDTVLAVLNTIGKLQLKPNAYTFIALHSIMRVTGNLKATEELITEMSRQQIPPNNVVWRLILNFLLRTSNKDMLVNAWGECAKLGLTTSSVQNASVFRFLLKAGGVREALQVWNTPGGHRADMRSANAVISGLQANGFHRQADLMYEDATQKGLQFDRG
ncbi:hypothetical protein HK101_001113 [Irineochytrium annulatum]|nr:hypothetical protein HK101_001113 [Irineochytrium annulatum]